MDAGVAHPGVTDEVVPDLLLGSSTVQLLVHLGHSQLLATRWSDLLHDQCSNLCATVAKWRLMSRVDASTTHPGVPSRRPRPVLRSSAPRSASSRRRATPQPPWPRSPPRPTSRS